MYSMNPFAGGALLLLLLAALARGASAALPPGYEDRTFCPPGYCLGRRHPQGVAVGPKALFWECRVGDGSQRAAEAWQRQQEAIHTNTNTNTAASAASEAFSSASSERRPAMVEIQTWGPRVADAAAKLERFRSGGYGEAICAELHARPADGRVHTVYVPDDVEEDGGGGLAHRIGLGGLAGEEDGGGGASTRSLMAGGAAMACFVLLCCASSAMNAARAHEDARRDDDRSV